jgi:hypothetical protein
MQSGPDVKGRSEERKNVIGDWWGWRPTKRPAPITFHIFERAPDLSFSKVDACSGQAPHQSLLISHASRRLLLILLLERYLIASQVVF